MEKNKYLRRQEQLLKREKRLKKVSESNKEHFKKKPHQLDHDYGCSCGICKRERFSRKSKHKKLSLEELLDNEDE